MSYFASGLPMQSCEGGSAQNRKYNGKEFIEAYGLDETDLGMRNVYHAISRFNKIDRFAEHYPWQSPYVFAGNNPINFIDINGDSIYVDEEEQDDFTDIMMDIFGEDCDDFDFTDKGLLEYNGEEDDPINENPLFVELLSYINNTDIIITGMIFQNRVENGDNYTISIISTIGGEGVSGYILEPSGPSTTESNQNKRIPEGVYSLDEHNGEHYRNTYVLFNDKVPKQRGILYHAGNYPQDTKGCQLPGTSKGQGAVYGSSNKLKEIKGFIGRHGHKSTITIIYKK